ncbi:MAG: alpha/beta fold hydrolase [Candidatus Omnitrophica bacterium]|nr:alpha/beta fold hydrolase [Candidatus Omnitrophota bacterium]
MAKYQAPSGISWNYDDKGQGDVLVFLHGWGVDRRIWRQQIKYFSEHYRVLSVDLPGHGESSWKAIPMESMGLDFKAWLDDLKIDSMTLIGSSLGGMFSLQIYALMPDKIKSLVMVGSMPKFAKSEDYPYGLDISQIRKLNAQVNSDYPSIINVFFRSLFTREERATRRFRWLQRFRRDVVNPQAKPLCDYLNILEQEDFRDVLKQVTAPVQFINGTHDTICTKKTVDFLRQLCPRARFDFFDKCGHFPFLSQPYAFNSLLQDFLSRHDKEGMEK